MLHCIWHNHMSRSSHPAEWCCTGWRCEGSWWGRWRAACELACNTVWSRGVDPSWKKAPMMPGRSCCSPPWCREREVLELQHETDESNPLLEGRTWRKDMNGDEFGFLNLASKYVDIVWLIYTTILNICRWFFSETTTYKIHIKRDLQYA